MAVMFRGALGGLASLRDVAFNFAHHQAWGFLIPVVWCCTGAGLAVLLVRWFAPETSGSGIPHVEAVLYGRRPMRWQRVLPVKFLGGVVGIGGGMALGREGPTVQMGAAVGQLVGDHLDATPRENQALIAAGAAAGLAAAFNAPLAGVVFVLEELQRDFAPGIFTPSFLAAVTADVVTRAFLGQGAVYQASFHQYPPLLALPVFCLLGVFTGVFGIIFNRGLLGTLKFFGRIGQVPPFVTGAAVGLVLAAVGWVAPNALGDGHVLIERELRENLSIRLLAAIFVLRYVMTMLSYGCGAPGGIFAPLLVLGAGLGRMVGEGASYWIPSFGDHLPAFAAVGMAAYFTAIVRAPLTGTVLIIEMTGNYDLMLPLLASSLVAFFVAETLHDHPIYEALLQRDLLRTDEEAGAVETLLVDLQVHRDSPFEGKVVRELGLPHGCLLVSIRRAGHEIVPDADTRLEANDQVTAVIGPTAAKAVEVLRNGFQA
jgi:CIC family chloride channel protein